jgi:hypothetical protein
VAQALDELLVFYRQGSGHERPRKRRLVHYRSIGKKTFDTSAGACQWLHTERSVS